MNYVFILFFVRISILLPVYRGIILSCLWPLGNICLTKTPTRAIFHSLGLYSVLTRPATRRLKYRRQLIIIMMIFNSGSASPLHPPPPHQLYHHRGSYQIYRWRNRSTHEYFSTLIFNVNHACSSYWKVWVKKNYFKHKINSNDLSKTSSTINSHGLSSDSQYFPTNPFTAEIT